MKLKIQTSTYCNHRYGKPWIALVSFDGNRTEFDFGLWVGPVGEEGVLELDVNPGDVVTRGQNDLHKPANYSAPVFYIIDAHTQSDDLGNSVSKKVAYEHSQKLTEDEYFMVRQEKEVLMARLDEINQLLSTVDA